MQHVYTDVCSFMSTVQHTTWPVIYIEDVSTIPIAMKWLLMAVP